MMPSAFDFEVGDIAAAVVHPEAGWDFNDPIISGHGRVTGHSAAGSVVVDFRGEKFHFSPDELRRVDVVERLATLADG